jgi:hypothetical protein
MESFFKFYLLCYVVGLIRYYFWLRRDPENTVSPFNPQDHDDLGDWLFSLIVGVPLLGLLVSICVGVVFLIFSGNVGIGRY